MAADTQNLKKVDSAVEGLSSSPVDKKTVPNPKKAASSAPAAASATVHSITDLEKDGIEIKIAAETQKLNWKLNTSPATLGEPDMLKKPLTNPLVKKIDLHFPLGLEVTARNLKGVTIKDALDAIYKQYKKKQDDELDNPILAGFEWDKAESWTRLKVHQKKEGAPSTKKSKKKNADADADDD